jgi:hypothetical protein
MFNIYICYKNLVIQYINSFSFLCCNSLEKKIEEQHAIIDLLDHDLAEARKALTLPPGWNKINKIEIKKDTDVEAFEALKDLPTTNF